jgi:AcrR family transcriptional regulator
MSETCAARLTRAEKRDRTRGQLLDAAARVFADRGLDGATVDDVAAIAGYTKGAVYAHFGSKDELFLAMLEDRYAARMAELERVLDTSGDHTIQARTAGQEFQSYVQSDPDWQRLYLEATLRAARDGGFRAAFARRHREMHDRMARALEQRLSGSGLEATVPYDRLATVVSAVASGALLETMLMPAGSGDDLLGSIIELLMPGVVKAA